MDKPLIYFCISMVIGCLCAFILKNNLVLDVAIAASFFICIFLTCEKKYTLIMVGFFILGFLSFNFYFDINLDNKSSYTVRIITKNKFYAVGSYEGRNINISGNIFDVNEGEKIRATGEFKKDIDYSKGNLGTLKVKYIENSQEDIISHLYSFRKNIYRKFYWRLGENNTAKIMSVAFGDTSYLSMEDKYDFKKLGIVHVISVSGLHMVIIFKSLESFLNLEISIIVAAIYAIFTGAQAATLRSLIMIIILKLSKKFSKNYDAFSALSMAAMVLLMAKPYYVIDIGFALSFLSTLGISLFYKKLSKILYRLPDKINESVSLTLSAQSLSMPYVLFTIKNFALGFLLGDLFLIPMYSVIVVLSNIALVTCFIQPIFNILCMLINIVMAAISGGTSLLVKISPPMVYMSTINIIFILSLYPCYIFIKKGYEKFKFAPIILGLAIIIYQYNFFPKIDQVSLKSGSGFIVRYKGNNILISNYKIDNDEEKSELQGRFNVNSFMTNFEADYKIIINKKYLIYIPKAQGINNVIQVTSLDNNSSVIDLRGDRLRYKTVNWIENYAIMKIDINKENKKIDLPKSNIDFEIFMDKVIVYEY
ncbi:ComEC/Rec2 family competence protein [Clostridium pasteurianum]|uniref:ComEC/Rec2-related protein n=1 Tax=Clostridium pasteurianum BC1 TaxID=86416 RepID=R4KBS1_CLOPA|nr:ComEC/Rec2 family competence protein [Clostridium pasteurianum]AGK97060.1 ComEC/Rec2-related protein [Clostridium pasteurianum BC1]